MAVLAQQNPNETVALAHAQCHYHVSTNDLVGLGSQAGRLLPSPTRHSGTSKSV